MAAQGDETERKGFLVWKRGMRGAEATIDLEDPRSMPDFKAREYQIIQIVPLFASEYSLFSLDELKAFHPCPPYED